mgnify:CR=1 FL=1|tara:strand:+ start:5527 stop:6252 length:726 start_codon:yes stop_codon:yes gene_type:complete
MAIKKNDIEPLRIYIGFDERETIAWHVLVNSIMDSSSKPVTFMPLNLKNLNSFDLAKEDKRASNSFSYSRFLVPFLSGFNGKAIFMDCDMLMTTDIYQILEETENLSKAVHLVKHDYKSKVTEKYLGNKQENYPRKNWSSFVVWNCSHAKNKILTPEYIKSASPAHLHRFLWLEDSEIGELERDWNWLVTEYEVTNQTPLPKNIHWTLGGPYFNEYADSDFSDLWRDQFSKTIRVDQHEKN